ncbi:uracil-DNA glycosylase family protein [Rufibacter sp. LB8]|uniref:uracil-DNA glycosylase family protein n=1 Tax=Rufibacter sp. LB8 TaxID=2777781 RepID=UPI00178C5AB6|nr:uracil-DNA glycosylase family protein [Rufibacter sp. LB8]
MMIKEFFYKKYGTEVTDSIMTASNEVIVESKNSDITKHHLIKKHLIDITVDLDISPKLIDQDVTWGMDFSGWIGSYDSEVGKEYMIIGAEPSISRNYQLVYGFGNKYNLNIDQTASYHYEKEDDIWSYFTRLLIKENESIRDFLEKCYITDLCHIVPQGCGTVESICKKLNITAKEWETFRTSLAKKFLLEEIELVKPKLLVLHGNVSRDFFKTLLKIKFESIGKIKNTKYSISKAEWKGIPILSIPHLKGQVRNKLWKCADKERFESAKNIVKYNFN